MTPMPAHIARVVFPEAFNEFSALAWEISERSGFHEAQRTNHPDAQVRLMSDVTKLALAESELGEATEAIREGNPPSEKIPGFSSLEEEVADCIIRLMDFAATRGLRVGEAIVAKMAYNRTRPTRHGKFL